MPRLFRLCLILLSALASSPAWADRITVFAAASMTGVLDEIAQGFMADSGHEVVLSYAGSSTLARQIEQGAPADVFISANSDWMDYLEGSGKIAADTRFDFSSNRLVLIATGPEGPPVKLDRRDDLVQRLGAGRLAMALVEAVPAGIYGKTALEKLGLWDSVAPRVAQTDNVRAALALVAVGAAPLGVVYASDAQAEPRVHVVAIFPETSHPPILYPAAAVAGRDTDAVRAFLDHLQSGAAQDALRAHGLGVAGQ